MRILVIDDSRAYGDEFNLLLATSGIVAAKVDLVATAAEAARLMADDAYDIYFVDHYLPGDNGLTLVADARSKGVTRPIIVLTGSTDPQTDHAAEQAGASDYLTKGEFSPQMLGRAIRYAVRNAAAVQTARAAESRFRMAQEAGKIGVWDWDLRTNAVLWSPRQYEIYGLDPATAGPLMIDQWHAFVHPDDRAAVRAEAAAAVAGPAPFDSLFRILRHTSADASNPGALRWIATNGEVERDPGGAPIRMIGVSVDVTDQQSVVAKLRDRRDLAIAGQQASDSRFKTYFDNSAEWLFYVIVTPDGRFLYEAVNSAGLAHVGLTLEMMRGRSPDEVLSAEAGSITIKALRHVCDTGQPYFHEPTLHMRPGAVTYDTLYVPVRDAAGKVVGILGTARDITERRRLEAALRQTQKMETLGLLAAGLAHDFNNVLQVMIGNLQLILDETPDGSEIRRYTEVAVKSGLSGARLTAQLLSFARKRALAPHTLDVALFFRDLRAVLARTLGPHITIKTAVAASTPAIFVDPDQLGAALLNLAINAGHAMAAGGELRLEADVEPAVDGGKSMVVIAVCDTGIGMSPATLARAMEPFFTTKGTAGTGLGVSMVEDFARQSGGQLRLSSVLGQGTRAEIVLPAQNEVFVPANPVADATIRGAGRILLVDDLPDVLFISRRFLEQAGFAVTTAVSGDDALAELSRGAPFDALVADYAMPGLTGIELVKLAREMRPGLPAIVITGFPEVDTALIAEVAVPLRKPFLRLQLVKAVLDLVSAPVVPTA